jgi:hypothetical protein
VILIDPLLVSGNRYFERIERLCHANGSRKGCSQG